VFVESIRKFVESSTRNDIESLNLICVKGVAFDLVFAVRDYVDTKDILHRLQCCVITSVPSM